MLFNARRAGNNYNDVNTRTSALHNIFINIITRLTIYYYCVC